ncbi:MAG: hypothetical protein Q8P91_01290 [bacterium]|nr:hypothetical protein [bacterium]
MVFAKDMLDTKVFLEKRGHKVALPEGVEEYTKGKLKILAGRRGALEGAKRKINYNLIKKHYYKIQKSDAILVINKEKNGIKNYIGGNSFLEMGYAYILNKKIYLLNKLPKDLLIIYQELVAMKPIVLHGNLNVIK